MPRPTDILERRKYIGMNVLRTEDPVYLTGRAKYTDDVQLPGMLHAAFLRSPHPHARVRNIGTERAMGIPGVRAVITQSDLDGVVGPITTALARPEVVPVTRPALDSRVARYVGQPIAIVVGTSRYLAEDGVDALDVDWEPREPLLDAERALEPDAPLVREDMTTNNFAHIEFQRGEVDDLFANADRVFRKRFHHGRCSAAPLENRGVIADWDLVSGDLTLWSSNQNPHMLRTFLGAPLGIAGNKMRVIADHVGGGFGLKAHAFDEDHLIPAAAKVVGAPVKWTEDRYEHLAASLHSQGRSSSIFVSRWTPYGLASSPSGATTSGVGGAHPSHPWTPLLDPPPAVDPAAQPLRHTGRWATSSMRR